MTPPASTLMPEFRRVALRGKPALIAASSHPPCLSASLASFIRTPSSQLLGSFATSVGFSAERRIESQVGAAVAERGGGQEQCSDPRSVPSESECCSVRSDGAVPGLSVLSCTRLARTTRRRRSRRQ
eukprot:2328874-Rhodomonas_salina.1